MYERTKPLLTPRPPSILAGNVRVRGTAAVRFEEPPDERVLEEFGEP